MTFVGCWSPCSELARVVEEAPDEPLYTYSRATGSVTVLGHYLVAGNQFGIDVDAMLGANDVGEADKWPGCYSLVMITRTGVTLLPDPVGQFPLFVTKSGPDVWFGTRAVDVARHTGARLDPISLAVTLVCPESWDLNRNRTMFRGIVRVPEGYTVSIEPAGIIEREHRPIRVDPRATLPDSAERLRLTLAEAVNARLEIFSRPTSDLSGGLDSTSIAFLAARRVPELPVLTSYNPRAPVEDDLYHARRSIAAIAGFRRHEIPMTPDQLPYQVIGPIGDSPHASSIAMGGLASRLAAAADLGSDVHLVGEGGDVVLGAPLAYFADLARRGELARLWRDCVAWARLRGRAPLTLFRRALMLGATSRHMALRGLAASLESGHPTGEPTWEQNMIGYWPPPFGHWLARTTRSRLAAYVRDTADRLPRAGPGTGEVVTLGRLRQQVLTQQAVRDTGTALGVTVHAPFLDSELVRTCLTLSASRRADSTVPKPLLLSALRGLVPDDVLTRRTKGDYTRDAYQGVRRAAPTLRRLLLESAAADYGLIEPRPVLDALEGAIDGLPTPWGPLNQALAVEVWLRKHEQHGSTA